MNFTSDLCFKKKSYKLTMTINQCEKISMINCCTIVIWMDMIL